MKLVLDSSIYCQDYRLSSTNFRYLKEGLRVIPADLKVPEVVFDEVVNRFREDLEEASSEFSKAESKMNRLLLGLAHTPAGSPDIEREAAAFSDWFKNQLEELRAEIRPYPNVPHKKIVERDLQRKRPFKRDGSGYRDFLIWETIRGMSWGGHEQLMFITANTKDFGEGPRVIEDLRADMSNPNRLVLVPSLNQFADLYVIPRLTMLDGLRQSLESRAGTNFDILQWLRKNLLNYLWDDELGPIVAGLPDGVGSVHPWDIVALNAISIRDVRELSSGEKVVQVVVDADLDCSVVVDWADYVAHEEVRDMFGHEDESFGSASWNVVEKLTIGIAFVLDSTAKEIVSAEIGSIEGPHSNMELTSW